MCVFVCAFVIGTDALATDDALTLGNSNLKLPDYAKDTMSADCKGKALPCKSIDAAIGKRERERESAAVPPQIFFFC